MRKFYGEILCFDYWFATKCAQLMAHRHCSTSAATQHRPPGLPQPGTTTTKATNSRWEVCSITLFRSMFCSHLQKFDFLPSSCMAATITNTESATICHSWWLGARGDWVDEVMAKFHGKNQLLLLFKCVLSLFVLTFTLSWSWIYIKKKTTNIKQSHKQCKNQSSGIGIRLIWVSWEMG